SQVFSTAGDGQTQVEIHVVQGERPMATDNKSLGRFSLDGIPPAPRGVPQVEVTFDIDANGILKVTAQDKATGRSQHITITASSGLNEAEIERMRKEAEANAEVDRTRKELVEVRNHADNTAYTAEKSVRDFGDKIPADLKSQLDQKAKQLRETMKSDNIENIRQATDELGQLVQKVGGSMYQQPGAEAPGAGPAPEAGPSGGSAGGPSGGEDVVDGEFRNA
ncbi:MAG: Hsp70 family protein, partial [Kiritimatiellota bacterium]|nr:Hsp70 family protein [Kiritimatiellota bacterium]